MGAHYHHGTAVTFFAQQVFDHLGIHGVQRAEGFINNHELRLMHQRGNELRLLLHAFAQLFDLLFAVLCQVKALQPGADALLRFGGREPLEGRQVDQHPVQPLVLVQAAFFGQVANAVFLGLVHRAAQHGHAAGIGLEDVENDADGGGFSGAVGAQQAKDFAGVHLK